MRIGKLMIKWSKARTHHSRSMRCLMPSKTSNRAKRTPMLPPWVPWSILLLVRNFKGLKWRKLKRVWDLLHLQVRMNLPLRKEERQLLISNRKRSHSKINSKLKSRRKKNLKLWTPAAKWQLRRKKEPRGKPKRLSPTRVLRSKAITKKRQEMALKRAKAPQMTQQMSTSINKECLSRRSSLQGKSLYRKNSIKRTMHPWMRTKLPTTMADGQKEKTAWKTLTKWCNSPWAMLKNSRRKNSKRLVKSKKDWDLSA